MTERVDILKAITQYAKETGKPFTHTEGSNHTRVWVGDAYTTIPRHREIPNKLAEKIYKQIGMK